MTPILIPNFHVALIHFPIALLLIGVACEVVCSFGTLRAHGARSAGRWMILLGTALSWPALYSGIAAIRTLTGEDFSSSTWSDIRAHAPILSNPGAWETLRTHLIINAGATLLASVVVIVWLMAGVATRERLRVPALLAMLLTAAAILVGAWHGGELVYYHDVTRIADSPGREATTERPVEFTLRTLLPPLDTHVTLAGVTTGLCLLAWGVAARSRRVHVPADPAVRPPAADAVDPASDRIFAAFQPATIEVAADPPSPVLGLFAALAALVTAGFGVWVVADAFESWSPAVLIEAVVDAENGGGFSRRLAHLAGGLVLIVLPVIVAWAGGRSRKRRVLPLVLGTALLGAVIAQTWVGILLLVDSNVGSVIRLNP